MAVRDTQRNKVYSGDSLFHESDTAPRFEDLRSAQTYVNRILKTSTFLSLSPSRTGIIVKRAHPTAHQSHAEWNGMVISISQFGFNRMTIMHEVSHSLIMRAFGSKPVANHGPEYCSIYRLLVQDMYTKADALRWEKCMLRHGVRFNTESVLAKIRN